jgi:hypothetical protein
MYFGSWCRGLNHSLVKKLEAGTEIMFDYGESFFNKPVEDADEPHTLD